MFSYELLCNTENGVGDPTYSTVLVHCTATEHTTKFRELLLACCRKNEKKKKILVSHYLEN